MLHRESGGRPPVVSGPDSSPATKIAAALSTYRMQLDRPLTTVELVHFTNLARLTLPDASPIDPTIQPDIGTVTYSAQAIIDNAGGELRAAANLKVSTTHVLES